jgi:hypothetical protein
MAYRKQSSASQGDKPGTELGLVGSMKTSLAAIEVGANPATLAAENSESLGPTGKGYDPDAPNFTRPYLHFNFDHMVDYRRLVTSQFITPEQLLGFRFFSVLIWIAWVASSVAEPILNFDPVKNPFQPYRWLFFFTSINALSLLAYFIVRTNSSSLALPDWRGLASTVG